MIEDKEIQENWNRFLKETKYYFKGERQEKIFKMYEHFGDRMKFAPASGYIHFHNCFPGGYVDHVLRVLDCAIDSFESWKIAGLMKCSFGFEYEELAFSALFHDLGKIGDVNNDYYIEEESDWYIKNRGRIYSHNPNIPHMQIPDRSLFILQWFGIKITQNEFLAIKLHDGLYDPSNERYLDNFADEKKLKNDLPRIIHEADAKASSVEYRMWKEKLVQKPTQKEISKPKQTVIKKEKPDPLFNKPSKLDLFNDLFKK